MEDDKCPGELFLDDVNSEASYVPCQWSPLSMWREAWKTWICEKCVREWCDNCGQNQTHSTYTDDMEAWVCGECSLKIKI